jgi:predicted molibdopterin-dependent oxidoreductase YjgC
LATITVDGREVEAPEGANLLETLKNAGTYMSNLCYIDGLAPYAGCRTCLVEIEGARGLQLSCTSKVADKMIVRTEIPEVAEARKQVVSIILANHSDRCLTCHRREHCHPGDICLRDGVVTHRCLTCPKNYRCELQVTCEVVGMSLYEPWEGEARSFYAAEEYPPADQGNPFLEFDPKMCIICTRCVRACDELRHTSAITLAGRGFGTRIAFGAGGPIDESSCDFCGACIDVCPTATLLEHPHKWTSKPEEWVPTVCSYCSVGCTINLGVKDGRGVMVRPHGANPVSKDQICVRGRFHYDALRRRDYLSRPLIHRGEVMAPVNRDEAISAAADSLARIRSEYGSGAIGFLGGALSSNEELYLLQRLARGIAGTNNIDSTAGPIASRVASAIRGAFGSEVLPADLTALAQSTHIVVVGDDLEASHPVASLRIKDAVTRNNAQLITVCERHSELVDFSESWLRPRPGDSAAVLTALAQHLVAGEDVRRSLAEAGVGGVDDFAPAGNAPSTPALEGFDRAREVLADAISKGDDARVAVVFAPVWGVAWASGELARSAANLAIIVAGPSHAPESFFYLPTDVNVIGQRDVGAIPELLPGYHALDDEVFRGQLSRVWGTEPPLEPGLDLRGMLDAARSGALKALVVLGDDPVMRIPDTARVREALERLELLVVIDSVMTETAKLATIVLPDVDVYGKDGTYTPADRRILRRVQATDPVGDARPAWETLVALGGSLGSRMAGSVGFDFAGPSDVMDEIAGLLPLYAGAEYAALVLGGRSDSLNGAVPRVPSLSQSQITAESSDSDASMVGADYTLVTGRSLYTSYEAASLHKPDADKLHREDKLEINDLDAERLGIQFGDRIRLVGQRGAIEGPVKPTSGVAEGTVYVSALYGGGAVNALLADDGLGAATPIRIEQLT